MKIGIITFHWAHNYGAVLQAYALQTYLEKQGHHVEIIDYRPVWANDNKGRRIPLHFAEAIHTLDFYLRRRMFRKFCRQYLHLSPHQYKYGEIITGYDAVITGSDQVFNPDIICPSGILDDTYLLASVAEGTKKISYAASFGNSTLAPEFTERFKVLLSQFDAISIREESGVDIVKRMGIEATAVPDPTILLGDFSALKSKFEAPDEDYTLSIIFQPTENTKKIQQTIENILHSPLYQIQNLYNRLHKRRGFWNPMPGEWIRVIGSAKFVTTDSFHSTVFCILNHTPFITTSLNAWGGDWSERIKFLLIRLELEDRLLSAPTEEQITKACNTHIDWKRVDLELAGWRSDGREFLLDNLK